jgi:hypothetical protein
VKYIDCSLPLWPRPPLVLRELTGTHSQLGIVIPGLVICTIYPLPLPPPLLLPLPLLSSQPFISALLHLAPLLRCFNDRSYPGPTDSDLGFVETDDDMSYLISNSKIHSSSLDISGLFGISSPCLWNRLASWGSSQVSPPGRYVRREEDKKPGIERLRRNSEARARERESQREKSAEHGTARIKLYLDVQTGWQRQADMQDRQQSGRGGVCRCRDDGQMTADEGGLGCTPDIT